MVEVPDRLIAKHIITQAREYGEYGSVHDTAAEGKHGQYEYETEWSLADIDPDECEVEVSDESIVVHAAIMASYTVQVRSATYNPPGKAHPAEYENREIPLHVSISMELDDLPTPVIDVERA